MQKKIDVYCILRNPLDIFCNVPHIYPYVSIVNVWVKVCYKIIRYIEVNL